MKQYNRMIDVQRFLFALVVLICHGHHFTTDERYLFMGGGIAVDFFFLLSGVMFGVAVEKTCDVRDIGLATFEYMKHRVKRFVPDIYIAWLIGVLLDFAAGKEIIRNIIVSAGEFLLIDQTGFLNYRFNDVSWYISALLLVSFILYPIAVKNKSRFFYLVTPAIFVFLLGYTYQNWTTITVLNWNGVCYNTLIRAAMEMSAGCICYKMAAYLKRYRYRVWVRVLISIISWMPIGLTLGYALYHEMTIWSWYLFLMLMVSMIATLTNQGIDQHFLSERITKGLGRFAFCLYLGHGSWRWFLKTRLPESWTYYQKLLVYCVISFCTAIFIIVVSKIVRRLWYVKRKRIKSMFVVKD